MFKTTAIMALSRVTEIPGRALNEPSSVCRGGCCDSHARKCWAVEVPQEMVVLHNPLCRRAQCPCTWAVQQGLAL